MSRDQRAVLMLLTLPVLFYFGKNAESTLVNAISALVGLVIVVYLLFHLFGRI